MNYFDKLNKLNKFAKLNNVPAEAVPLGAMLLIAASFAGFTISKSFQRINLDKDVMKELQDKSKYEKKLVIVKE